MNKRLAASILAAVFPLSVFGAGGNESEGLPYGHNADKVAAAEGEAIIPVDLMKAEGRMYGDSSADGQITPVDLDAASKAYDIVLPTQPVHMTSDSLIVRNADHYVQGRGNVDMQQGMDELHTNYVEGNTQSQLYYTPGPAVYMAGENTLTGTGITYRGDGSATMDTIEGFMGPGTYVRGTDAEFVNGVGYVRHGLITTPHAVAKTPDYYLTGDDIRIYPGEKFTSENTALWFKHVRILTYGHYEGRLDNTDNRNTWLFTLLPRPTYNSDDGLGVRGNASFPMNQNGDLHFDIEYIYNSQNGFKPSAWLEKNAKLGTFRFGYGSEESSDNDDNIWATKWPEVQYYMPRLYLGQTGIYIDGSATWGRWAEDGQETGTHYGYRTEITHKPLPLWTRANIRFYSGYRRDWYSVQDAKRSDPYWGAVLSQSINDRLWTTFWYTKHNISGYTPYRFDTIDNPRQKGVSVGYVLTPRDTIIYSMSQNLDNKDIDRYYTWVRDLHSFTAIITYKNESDDDEWDIFVIPKDFRF